MTKALPAILLFIALAFPSLCIAMPCHCFNQKDFVEGDPAAADPYYLATAQNTLFSNVFGISKEKVVFAKQKPRATAEGLWIAYWFGQKSDADPKALLKARYGGAPWKEILSGLRIEPKHTGERAAELLAAGGDESSLASFVIDEILISKGVADTAAIQDLRRGRASDQETILAALLSLKTGVGTGEIYRNVRNREKTWGTLLLLAGMDGTEMEREVALLLGSAGG